MEKYSWGHHRPFNAYVNHIRSFFGERVQKISINAGFTCPNRDGTLSTRGCTYCNNDSFSPSYCGDDRTIMEQIEMAIPFHKKRYGVEKFLAYFQTYSNTYGDLDRLRSVYDVALKHPDIVGVVVGTRPDVIDDEKLLFFRELSKKMYVSIEYGIESCYDKTLQRINRHHTFEQSCDAVCKTASYGIPVGGHLMFGFPGETKEMMFNQVSLINDLPLQSIKFHQLQIMKNTPMAKEYLLDPEAFLFFEMEEYIDYIIDFVERLNPKIMIERFSGETPPRYTLSPIWGKRSSDVLSLIERRFKQRNSWQGKYYQ